MRERKGGMMAKIIWAYAYRGNHRTLAHAAGDIHPRRSLCGRYVRNTGDDASVPEVECKRCLQLLKQKEG